MAVYWNAAAIFDSPEAAAAFSASMAGATIPTPAGLVPVTITVGDGPSGPIVGLWPEKMSHASPLGSDPRLTEDDAREAAARFFEARFRGARGLRLATFGAEVCDLFFEEALDGIVGDDGLAGCVIGERDYERLGCPPGAEPFGEGLFWWPRTRTP